MTIEQRQSSLAAMCERYHSRCPVCGDVNPHGLRVAFNACDNDTVEATVVCSPDREGYAGRLHGGVVASLLDGAMTNCLFSFGIQAVTGELLVKLMLPLKAGAPIAVRGWIERRRPPLYLLRAELRQYGRLSARGTAKFVRTHNPSITGDLCAVAPGAKCNED